MCARPSYLPATEGGDTVVLCPVWSNKPNQHCSELHSGCWIFILPCRWFDGGVPIELVDDLAVMIDSHAPDAVAFQGPERHNAGYSGNVVRWSGTETGHTPSEDMWSTYLSTFCTQ